MSLPSDFSTDIPEIGLLFLLKAGVSADIASHYRFGWSEKMGRVVMPVYNESDTLRTTQSRAVYPDQKPKYMNKRNGDMQTVAFYSDDSLLLGDPLTDCVVMTEDILSCIRVGRLNPCISTLGTNLSNALAVQSFMGFKGGVLIWYDGDEAGVKGANKAKKTLTMLGVQCTIIFTDKDPKEYNNAEIKGVLNNAR